MSPRLRIAGVFILALLPLLTAAQEKAPDILARAFRVPPPNIASDDPLTDIIDAKPKLEAVGVTFPPGASATLYHAADIMVVRNTAENMERISEFIASVHSHGQPVALTLTLHLIQAPGALLRPLTTGAQPDHTQELESLLAKAATPSSGVQILHTQYIETRGGQRCLIESIADHLQTSHLQKTGGESSLETAAHALGFRTEIDAHFYESAGAISLGIAPKFTQSNPPPHQETTSAPAVAGLPASPMPPPQTAETQTALSLKPGQSRLMAIWPAHGDTAATGADLSQAVFVTAHAIPQQATPTAFMLPPLENHLARVQRIFTLPAELLANSDLTPASLKELLDVNGVRLPEGSSVTLHSPKRITVTTTAEMMPVVEAWARRYKPQRSSMINATIEIIRAPAPFMREIIRACASSADHAEAVGRLRMALGTGEAQLVTVAHHESRPGQDQSKLESGTDRHRLDDLSWDKTGRPSFITQRQLSGLSWKWNPVYGLGDPASEAPYGTMHVTYSLRHDHTTPTSWQESITTSPGHTFTLPRDEFRHASVQSAGNFHHDRPRLIAAWRPVGENDRTEADVLDAVILTCRAVQFPPQIEKKEQQTTAPASEPSSPDQKIIFRTYRIPPDFLSSTSTDLPGAPPTPSSASTQTAGFTPSAEPRALPPRPTAEDILKLQGISFPEGSSAHFNPTTSRLYVHNTEANHQLIAAFVKSLSPRGPRLVALTLHIIEAPAPIAHRWLSDHISQPDHTSALQQLLSRTAASGVRPIATLNLTTESGNRASVSHTREHAYISYDRLKEDDTRRVDHETVPVGTSLHADPAIEADNLTTSMNLEFIHHPAPPTLRTATLPAPAGSDSPPTTLTLTDFHSANYQGTLRMPPGARIISIWQPTGHPHFTENHLLHIAILQTEVITLEE